MKQYLFSLIGLALLSLSGLSSSGLAQEKSWVGRYALTLPDGRAGWLGVEQKNDQLSASLLWGGGSVLPVTNVKVVNDELVFQRVTGNNKQAVTQEFHVTKQGDSIALESVRTRADGKEAGREKLTGKRIAELPPAPVLSKVQFNEPKALLDDSLSQWQLVNEKDLNGWTIKDGVLMNRVQKEPGKHFGNLRTKEEFGDCRVTVDVRTQEGSNSGIYIRGIYEVQVAETYGKPVDSHNMGALYSRITPSVAAEKPIGEWQTLDITVVDRHITVILNGKTIIDNQPVLGCTGGAMTSDEFKPGPLFLQGDHTNVDYRNLMIYTVKK